MQNANCKMKIEEKAAEITMLSALAPLFNFHFAICNLHFAILLFPKKKPPHFDEAAFE